LFEYLPAAAVTCATPLHASVSFSPFSSSPTTPHTVAGWRPSCVWSDMRYGCWRQCPLPAVPWCPCRVTRETNASHVSQLRAVKILGNYCCIAVYCDTKLILGRSTLKLHPNCDAIPLIGNTVIKSLRYCSVWVSLRSTTCR